MPPEMPDGPSGVLAGLEGREFEDIWTWDERDAILYALAVGARPATDLAYLSERCGPSVLDLLCSIPLSVPWSVRLLADTGLSALFFDHAFTLSATLPPGGTVECRARVGAVWDTGRSAFVEVTSEVGTGSAVLATARAHLYLPGAGGFGGAQPPAALFDPPAPSARAGPADVEIGVETRDEQAALFRTVGDYVHRAAALAADVHIDRAVAVGLGLDGPILPGTCVLGIVARILAAHRASPDGPAAGPTFRELSARYVGVAYPGRDLTIRVWWGEGGWASYAVVADDARPVLTGRARYA